MANLICDDYAMRQVDSLKTASLLAADMTARKNHLFSITLGLLAGATSRDGLGS